MAVAAEVLVANEEGLRKLLFMTSVLVFCAATAVVFQGFKVTSWDTKDKLMVQVASLDKDIEGLRRKIGRRG